MYGGVLASVCLGASAGAQVPAREPSVSGFAFGGTGETIFEHTPASLHDPHFGARVYVDGKYVGEAPLSTELQVGARAIQVSKGGYSDFFQNVSAIAGQELMLDVQLEGKRRLEAAAFLAGHRLPPGTCLGR